MTIRYVNSVIRFVFIILMLSVLLNHSVRGQFQPTVDTNLSIGIWRAEIKRPDGQVIPFLFQTRINNGKLVIYVINGDERLLVDNIIQRGDSIFIEMPFFDSRFAARIKDNENLQGSWIKNYGNRQTVVPFRAFFNEDERFPNSVKPTFNISGRWSVVFRSNGDSTIAVGEFKQKDSKVHGTFLTTTGDYRYLDGIVSGDTLKLSTFDGGHAYKFISRIPDSNNMSHGYFYSSATSIETWTACKNPDAKLPDEYSLTHLRDPAHPVLDFTFPNLQGKNMSLTDSIFKNKVVIIQILGSWCPNCMDETAFLSPYYNTNKTRGLEIVGMAYERTTSLDDAKRLLKPFIQRFNVQYPILFTGVTVSDSLRTEKTLPGIQQIIGFPTTIFIDKKGVVRRIHTGFNGPGTGEHFDIYKKEFEELMNKLISE